MMTVWHVDNLQWSLCMCLCGLHAWMHVLIIDIYACMSFELGNHCCTGYNRLMYVFGVKELTCISHRVYAVCGHVMCM